MLLAVPESSPDKAPLRGSFQPQSGGKKKNLSKITSQLLWTKHRGLLKFINIQWCLYLNTYLSRNLQSSAIATHIILEIMHGFDFIKKKNKNFGKQLKADSRTRFPLWEWASPTTTTPPPASSSGWSLARLRTVSDCPGSPGPEIRRKDKESFPSREWGHLDSVSGSIHYQAIHWETCPHKKPKKKLLS